MGVPTPWLFLTAGSSMSTTTPTTPEATWLRSPMTALLPIPMIPSWPLLATALPLLSTLPLLSMLPLLYTLPLLTTLLLSTTHALQARALTSPSRSLTRERRGPPARPRLSDPRSPLYPRLIPSVTRLSPVWLSISDREL